MYVPSGWGGVASTVSMTDRGAEEVVVVSLRSSSNMDGPNVPRLRARERAKRTGKVGLLRPLSNMDPLLVKERLTWRLFQCRFASSRALLGFMVEEDRHTST